MQAYSTPEIQRVPLDSLLLQMISIGIPDCRKFPFIEPPVAESIESSILRLKQQVKNSPVSARLNQFQLKITGRSLAKTYYT